jgi:hypothetical protein
MASIEDAIEALTDPECLTLDGRSRRYASRGVVGISGSKVAIRLQALDPQPDEREPHERAQAALDLARQAARMIGAREIVETFASRSLPGHARQRDKRSSIFEVPAERLRDQT